MTTIAYNSFGQPTSVQGPIATEPPTTFAYDTNGNLITTTDPLGNATHRVYDAVSRLTSLTDPRGLQTQFRYDGLNRVTEIADARQGLTRFSYDRNGNLLSVQDAKGQVTSYTYDSMDRLKTRKDALNRQETYDYDPAGNLSTFLDRKHQPTTFEYDALDRQKLISYADGSTVAVAYDAVGNVTKLTDSVTGAIDWTYDLLDRVTQEVTPQGILTYTYDAISRRLTLRANAQQPITYGYDANSQLSQVAQGPLSATVTHDAFGRRTQLQRSNGVTTTYTYDPASRLLGLTHAKGSTVLEQLTHGFDPADNKTQVTQLIHSATALPPAVTAAYNALNQQTQFASATLGYDNNGNLTSAGPTTYTWDARDRLVGISGGTTATFSYDALDRRISKTINGATTTYLYDGADIVTESGATNASYLSTLNIDEPLVRQTPSGNEYYQTDDLGSTMALSDDTGTVTTRYTYGPFGSTTVTGSSTNPFQYTGRENDGTGLYYYRARYYSPSHARFLAEDPLEFGGGDINLYAYVWNSPVNFRDASGLAVRAPGHIPPECEPPTIGERKDPIQRGLHNLGCADSLLPAGGLSKATAAVKAAGKAGKGIGSKCTGICYKRTDKSDPDGKPYIGRSKNDQRYEERQREHSRANPDADYEFKELGRAKPGDDLRQLEQKNIDKYGGPTNKSNPNGGTANKRNEIR